MKSFHQKQCKNLFHRDINIGLMGVKDTKEKTVVSFSPLGENYCHRLTQHRQLN